MVVQLARCWWPCEWLQPRLTDHLVPWCGRSAGPDRAGTSPRHLLINKRNTMRPGSMSRVVRFIHTEELLDAGDEFRRFDRLMQIQIGSAFQPFHHTVAVSLSR